MVENDEKIIEMSEGDKGEVRQEGEGICNSGKWNKDDSEVVEELLVTHLQLGRISELNR